MSAQIITNQGKPAFAVVPIDEYEQLLALVENNVDAKDAARIAARLSSGDEELLPADFVKALVAAKAHPLRLWRQHRGFTLSALGEACGVTGSALSQIETGKTIVSTALLKKLAAALRCNMDDLG